MTTPDAQEIEHWYYFKGEGSLLRPTGRRVHASGAIISNRYHSRAGKSNTPNLQE
jgi:hypothetical protein